MNNRVSIYVPSTYAGNKPAKGMQRTETKRTAKYLCKLNGGATQTTATGFYMSDAKGLIQEKQNIVYSYCDTIHRAGIINFAKRLCKRMQQESIAVEFNNELIFVES